MKGNHLSREQLYRYDDGELSVAEKRSVERHLAICADCRARVARSAAIVDALKQELGGTRAPASLRGAIREQVAARETRPAAVTPPRLHRLALATSAVTALLLLATILAVALALNGARPLVTQLIESHRLLAQDPQRVQILGNSAGLNTWVGDQVHAPIQVPTPEGFSVVGARVETVNTQPAAHILYRQANANALSLFIWRGGFSTDNLASRQMDGRHFYVGTQSGVTVVLWLEHDLNYACVGDAAPEAMLALAAHVWRSDNN